MDYASRILGIIESSRDHPTAEQLYLRMKEEGSRAVLATVYNNLCRLTERGQIRKISVPGQPDRYDRAARHDHLVCRECGALRDVSFPDITSLIRSGTGEEILGYDLRAEYLCAACRQRRGAAQGSSRTDRDDKEI